MNHGRRERRRGVIVTGSWYPPVGHASGDAEAEVDGGGDGGASAGAVVQPNGEASHIHKQVWLSLLHNE